MLFFLGKATGSLLTELINPQSATGSPLITTCLHLRRQCGGATALIFINMCNAIWTIFMQTASILLATKSDLPKTDGERTGLQVWGGAWGPSSLQQESISLSLHPLLSLPPLSLPPPFLSFSLSLFFPLFFPLYFFPCVRCLFLLGEGLPCALRAADWPLSPYGWAPAPSHLPHFLLQGVKGGCLVNLEVSWPGKVVWGRWTGLLVPSVVGGTT